MAKQAKAGKRKTGKQVKKTSPQKKIRGIVVKSDVASGQVIASVATRAFSRSGPLPPPEDFEHYERIVMGAGDRIITMAEKEQRARHCSRLFEFLLDVLKVFTGFLVVAILVAAAVAAAYLNQPFASTIFALGGISGVFLRLIFRERKKQTSGKE